MFIETLGTSFRKARSTNSTDATFPTKAATPTEPSGTGVFSLVKDSHTGTVQNGVRVVPYALGANDDTFSVRVIGWSSVGFESNPGTALWIPVTLVEYACICGASNGAVGFTILNTEFFADTVTLTTGDPGVTTDTVSPADDTIAHFMSDVKGFEKIEFTFQLGTTPTSMNCLFAML